MELRKYLFGGVTRQLSYKSLDADALRGRAVAQNLANVSTPGYKRKEVVFESELQKALSIKLTGASTHSNHIEISKKAALARVQPKVVEPVEKTLAGEVNNVDVDLEAAKMAENQIFFNYGIRFSGFDKFNSAIQGR